MPRRDLVNVVGIPKPALLDATLDSDVFISLPVAERVFRTQPNPSEIYVRANVNNLTDGDVLRVGPVVMRYVVVS